METLDFAVLIEAPKDKVWEVMLDPDGFGEWAAAFAEGFYYEGSWEEGETMRFLTPQRRGSIAEVVENRPQERISIKHVGLVKNGIEDTDSAEVRAWAPRYEMYTFSEEGGVTEVKVKVEVTDESQDRMGRTWPKALARLKALCEGA